MIPAEIVAHLRGSTSGCRPTESVSGAARRVLPGCLLGLLPVDALLGLRGADLDARATRYLMELELDDKVQIRDGAFSTTALSQGQRKRLALLTAFLEDRPIYVFDEWAADQDPHYREIFYRRLLPDLKARGKTVLVISHDDRYYHLASRIIRLEYGKVGVEVSGSPG